MCIGNEARSTIKPTDPAGSVPAKAPTREPSIPVKEPVNPDRRQMDRPSARMH